MFRYTNIYTYTFIPMPMPKTVCITSLYDDIVQLEVCQLFRAAVWV